jgi:hypothetical protein
MIFDIKMPGKVKVTPHMRNTPSGGRTHVRAQNRAPPKAKQPKPKPKPIKTKK